MGPQRGEMPVERPHIAAGHRSGQGTADPEGPGIGQGLLGKATVDGQRTGLVEAGHGAKLGDRIEEGDEAARREDRSGVVGGLGPGCEADRGRADGIGHGSEEDHELVVTLDRNGRPVKGGHGELDIGKGDERVERSDLGPSGHRRLEDLGPDGARGMDHGLAAIEAKLAGEDGQRVVGNREDDQLNLVEKRRRLREATRARDQASEPLAAGGIARGNGDDRPAGARQGHAEGRPNGARPHDPDGRRFVWPRVHVGVGVIGGMDLVAMTVLAGRDRIEVDAPIRELAEPLLHLGARGR